MAITINVLDPCSGQLGEHYLRETGPRAGCYALALAPSRTYYMYACFFNIYIYIYSYTYVCIYIYIYAYICVYILG